MKKITNDDILLETISENTERLYGPMWLENIKYNEEHYGFKDTINNLQTKASKTIVVAAGPAFRKVMRSNLELIMTKRENVTIVSCDGALSMLSQLNITPDYVVTVDPKLIILEHYKKSKNILNGTTAILATSTDPHVVEECINAGAKIKWIQPFFKNNGDEPYFRDGITSFKMGGNVGTTSYLIASFALRSKLIGLLGIEFAWSDDTPYSDTEYYEELLDGLENNPNKVQEYFVHQNNPRDGKTYIADPVYYAYFLMFKEIWKDLPIEVKESSFNLTSEGILNINGLKNIDVNKFLELSC